MSETIQRYLFKYCQYDNGPDSLYSPNPIDATAEQRARAAVMAFNLETT